MSQNIVIIGANRGIGLEMARIWSQRGDTVYATCRSPSKELESLDVNVISGVDVSTDEGIRKLQDALDGVGIDLLYHNAGIMRDENLQKMNYDTIREQFEVNTLAPLHTTVALLDRMNDGGKVGLMTSRMGSIADNDSGGRYGYRISKAGLNAAGKSLAEDLKSQGIAVGILHPGFVQTDMTGHNGHIKPAEAAERLVQRMDEVNLDNTGTFWHSDGSVLPW